MPTAWEIANLYAEQQRLSTAALLDAIVEFVAEAGLTTDVIEHLAEYVDESDLTASLRAFLEERGLDIP